MIFVFFGIFGAAPLLAEPPAATADIFRDLVQRRLSAYASGDADTYLSLIDPQFVHIYDNGRRRTYSEISEMVRGLGNQDARHRVENVNFRLVGDLAIADVIVVEYIYGLELRWRETDVFRPDQGRWRFLHHQETAILGAPEPVLIDEATLQDYVGRYQHPDGVIEVISREGTKLFSQMEGDASRNALVTIGADAFAFPGDAVFTYFGRDRTGKVTQLNMRHLTGKIVVARKIGSINAR
ncbi:DUF4440 domain-containing protein [Sphingomonas sp. RB56-2]|uniref:DUF4440 domain-containing protein n=1 Tax=Sphingomonas brevis TaxID=2908206 RepID=A0ABT0S7N6_9SPHN|nr:DUF4440 domain-containing protein [Sphingomonas brevis]MCL6740368.1 DUF4440 domain-containing protein [Sphingomonas brevis]